MKRVVIDIETPPIPRHMEKIHCIVTKELGQNCKVWTDLRVFNSYGTYKEFEEYATTVDEWIGHNVIGFDIPVLLHCLDLDPSLFRHPKVIDTFIVSRLVGYKNFNGHGLDEIGQRLGQAKTKFSAFEELTQEMIDYCIDDVKLSERIFRFFLKYIDSAEWSQSMETEHRIAEIIYTIQNNGFAFDVPKAKELLSQIEERIASLEPVFQEHFPPWKVEEKRLKYRVNKDGSLNKKLKEAMDAGDWNMDGDEVVFYIDKYFNPGSTKDRIEKLWECGWKPYMKTKTHQKFSRVKVDEMWGKSKATPQFLKEKRKYFSFYGWVVNEENLATLPESAPEGARLLAEWLTLEGRRSALQTWLDCVSDEGRIHGKLWGIGAWTHRMAHTDPNSANIASPFVGEPRNAVEEVKNQYDADMRSCWTASRGATLVGTDADGIQLRILAHYLRNEDYVQAIVKGKKENETDIHNVNKRALALGHLNRDHAKTFIYAWVLGAQAERVSSILKSSIQQAKEAMQNFVNNTKGLKELRAGSIERDARRGYFIGLDGRKVECKSRHLMMAGYLQNAEAVIMKRANSLWVDWANKDMLDYKQVNFVHDEWQTESYGTQVAHERLGYLQRLSIERVGEELGLFCPLAGSTDYGNNWLETH